jgi:hypothetical protein
MGQRRDAYRIVVGKRVGKGPFGRWRYRWDDNIKMDLKKFGGMVLTGLIWLWTGTSDRLS